MGKTEEFFKFILQNLRDDFGKIFHVNNEFSGLKNIFFNYKKKGGLKETTKNARKFEKK